MLFNITNYQGERVMNQIDRQVTFYQRLLNIDQDYCREIFIIL